MGGKPLRNLLCCYHPKAEDIRDELRPISGCYNQTYNAEQISPKQNIDLMRTNKAITLINEKCTYKRNESPQPVEVANLKPNGIKNKADNMIMLAAIHPYSNNNSNSNNTSDADKHTMKITDVTDQYLEDKDDEVQEGSLIEYCRINHHENAKCRPQIFLANKIIKITPLEHENFDKMA